MDEDKEIIAIFTEQDSYYYLHIDVVGNGRVTKSPDEDNYLEGTTVTLTALADNGWVFEGWAGDVKGSNSKIRVIMEEDKGVVATFVEKKNYYTLNVNVAGSGYVNREPNESVYEEGTRVILSAMPSSGWEFSGWSGDFSGNCEQITVIMDDNKNITASFSEIPQGYKLSIVIAPGEGTFTCEPEKESYNEGELVTVGVSQNITTILLLSE